MRTLILSATALLFSGTALADDATITHAQYQLIGTFQTSDGFIYGTKTHVDKIKVRGGAAYVQPEEYKLSHFDASGLYLENALEGISGKITCPSLDGPGIRAFDNVTVKKGITCQWKSRPGSNAEVIPFKLYLQKLKAADFGEVKYYKGFSTDGKTLKGELDIEGEVAPVEVKLDQASYRNGSSHKVWIRRGGQKVVYTKRHSDYRIKLLSCSNDFYDKGIDVITSKGSPSISCTFRAKEKVKGQGWLTLPTNYSVTLK